MLTPESCDLGKIATRTNVCKPKSSADQATTREYLLNLLGRGAGRHIKIFGRAAKQQVANAAAYDISLVTCLLQLSDNISGMRAKFCTGNAVF
jgi:hypothetical protein